MLLEDDTMNNDLYEAHVRIGQLTYNTEALLKIVEEHIDISTLDIVGQIRVEAVLETVKANMAAE